MYAIGMALLIPTEILFISYLLRLKLDLLHEGSISNGDYLYYRIVGISSSIFIAILAVVSIIGFLYPGIYNKRK
jgi:hypothetical protein